MSSRGSPTCVPDTRWFVRKCPVRFGRRGFPAAPSATANAPPDQVDDVRVDCDDGNAVSLDAFDAELVLEEVLVTPSADGDCDDGDACTEVPDKGVETITPKPSNVVDLRSRCGPQAVTTDDTCNASDNDCDEPDRSPDATEVLPAGCTRATAALEDAPAITDGGCVVGRCGPVPRR